MRAATKGQLAAIRARAVNAHSRIMASEGVKLSHAQAEALGEEALSWLARRLELDVVVDSDGFTCTLRVRA